MIRYCIKKIIYIGIFALVLLALFFGAGRGMAPYLNRYQPELEKWASDFFHQQVTIEKISLFWGNFYPELRLEKIKILDAKGKTVLKLNALAMGINFWRSLWHLRLQSSYVQVIGAELTVVCSSHQAHCLLSELSLFPASSEDETSSPHALDLGWLATESDLFFKNVLLHWQGKTFSLPNLHWVNHNNQGMLQGNILMREAARPGLISFSLVLSPLSRYPDIIFSGYLKLREMDLEQWWGNLSWDGHNIKEGIANGEVWFDGKNDHIVSVQSLFQLRDVAIDADLSIDHLEGHVLWKEGKWTAENIHFSFEKLHELASESMQVAGYVRYLSGQWQNNLGEITIQQGRLLWREEKLFSEEISLDKIAGKINFIKPSLSLSPYWKITSPTFELSNQDFSFKGAFGLSRGKGLSDPYLLNVLANIKINSSDRFSAYLPKKLMPSEVFSWLSQAFPQGKGAEGVVIFRGVPSQFPFWHNEGVFEIRANIQDTTFHYAPDWPEIKNLDAYLIVHPNEILCEASAGKIINTEIKNTTAIINNIASSAPSFVKINSAMLSDTKDILSFLQESPLKKQLGKVFLKAESQGNAELALLLDLPLAKLNNFILKGNLLLKNARLDFSDPNININHLNGRIYFTEKLLQATLLEANLENHPILAKIETTSVPDFIMHIRWKGEFDGKMLDHYSPLFAWLTISGKTVYQADLAWNLNPKASSQSELQLTSNLKSLAFAIPGLFSKASQDIMPFEMRWKFLEAIQLSFQEKQDSLWRIKISPNTLGTEIIFNSPLIQGKINWIKQNLFTKITGQFKKLHLNAITLSKMSNQQKFNPEEIPSLDFTVQDFSYRNISYGDLILQAEAKAHRYIIHALKLKNEILSAELTGDWRLFNHEYQSHLSGLINFYQFDTALKNASISSPLSAEKGEARLNFAWNEAIYNLSLPAMRGSLVLNLQNGRITELSQDASSPLYLGKLLTLLSLNRILSLGFTDLFQKGYSFNTLESKLYFDQGNIKFEPLLLDGSVAKIHAKGNANLSKELLNLSLTVTPYLTSSFPLVAAVAGGPIIGAVTFVADKLVGRFVNKMTQYHYRITGTFTNPIVKKQ